MVPPAAEEKPVEEAAPEEGAEAEAKEGKGEEEGGGKIVDREDHRGAGKPRRPATNGPDTILDFRWWIDLPKRTISPSAINVSRPTTEKVEFVPRMSFSSNP